MATYFVDLENGNNANDGLSFANRKLTVPALAGGDIVKVMASPPAVDTGLSGTWTGTGSATSRRRVTWSGAVTKTIDTGNSAWTASANVTRSAATGKTAANANQFAIAGGFTTGKVAYFAISSLNLSAYEQISFHIQCTSGTVPASSLKVCLCSDATGDVIVDSFVIDFAMPATSRWFPVTINKGAALGSAITSISIHADSDPGTVTVILGKVIACKAAASADALTLTDLVGKSTATVGQETWWPLRNILDSTETDPADSASGPMLEFEDVPNGNTSARSRGYVGASATANIYRRQTIKTAPVASGSSWITPGSAASVTGGWDRTNMTTQTDTTFVRGGGHGYGIFSSANTPTYGGFGTAWFDTGLQLAGTTPIITNWWAGACQTYGVIFGVGAFTVSGNIVTIGGSTRGFEGGAPTITASINSVFSYCAVSSTGINISAGGVVNVTGVLRGENNGSRGMVLSAGKNYESLIAKDNAGAGILFQSMTCLYTKVKSSTCTGNGTYGIDAQNNGRVDFLSHTSASNTSGTVSIGNLTASDIRITAASITDASIGAVTSMGAPYEAAAYFQGLSSGAAHRGYLHGAEITSETTDVDGAGGLAWKTKITSTNRNSANRVLLGPEAGNRLRKYVNAGSLVTVTVRAKKGDSIVSAQLRIPGGQLGMSASDVVDPVTAVQSTTGGYATYTVTCTPAVAGWLEISLDTWYNSGSLGANSWSLFDTISITQA